MYLTPARVLAGLGLVGYTVVVALAFTLDSEGSGFVRWVLAGVLLVNWVSYGQTLRRPPGPVPASRQHLIAGFATLVLVLVTSMAVYLIVFAR